MDNQMNQQIGGQYGIRGFPTIKVSVSDVYSSKKSSGIADSLIPLCIWVDTLFMMTARLTHDCFTSHLKSCQSCETQGTYFAESGWLGSFLDSDSAWH